MKVVKTNLKVEYTTAQMYDLVADISKYPEFLPWCEYSEILSKVDNIVEASLQVAKGPFQQKFATRNIMEKNKSIELELLDGPFSHLEGYWFFKESSNNSSEIEFIIEFEFVNPLISVTLSPVFNTITKSMVDSFYNRARQIYDKS